MMQEYIIGLSILVGLGLFFAVILAVASVKLKVFEDPRIDAVEDMLPHANCGACGQPGCRAFAELVIKGEVKPGKCTVSSPEAIEQIAGFLGIDAGAEERIIARLRCAGGKAEAHHLAEYHGTLSTCRGEAVVNGGPKACSWGCLGLGDCMDVCEFDAIHMNEDGLPVVTPDRCVACGDCVEICPKGLFELIPESQHLYVQCKSELEGDLALNRCSVACTACGKCVADASPGLVEIDHHVARVKTDLRHLEAREAIRRCPTNAIVWLEGPQFASPSRNRPAFGQIEPIRMEEDLENHYWQ
ncbi:MAG TPA: RnfABCDGE type electron transport complex subunit B [Saprospiraceae bacterium]|nr:RnfABCDGE type electron transport complex subunit B [Saprospiraceae bacterium]HRW75953.1 RnfABCDGE type electron transport complex subunit B [Saprospiraceae bacterium]